MGIVDSDFEWFPADLGEEGGQVDFGAFQEEVYHEFEPNDPWVGCDKERMRLRLEVEGWRSHATDLQLRLDAVAEQLTTLKEKVRRTRGFLLGLFDKEDYL